MRRKYLGLAIATVASLPVGGILLAQSESPISAADRTIVTNIAENSEEMQNLQFLTDKIGPRLNGTSNLKRATDWAADRFKAYGLSNVHLEPFRMAHSWHRGSARASVTSPVNLPLLAEVAGWSPNTPGTVRGRAIYVNANKEEDLAFYRGKLRGAIVLGSRPHPREQIADNPLLPRPPEFRDPYPRKFRLKRDIFFREEGVLGVLRDSDKSFGLFDMDIAGMLYEVAPLPTVYLTPEGYDLIWRLIQDQQFVAVELTVDGCIFSADPVEIYNVVGEIPGVGKPDETVILGAHLDSWDLGTGATDDGTGDVVVLEAARALRYLDLKPKRTIRFILFSGEEGGLNGSRAYVKAHSAELGKISAMLEYDAGAGRVKAIQTQGQGQLADMLNGVVAPLRQMIGLKELSLATEKGSDHYSFLEAGVPGFFCEQDRATYSQTHHSQADTYDKVSGADLINGAQVMAVFAYNVAELPDLLPRVPVSVDKKD